MRGPHRLQTLLEDCARGTFPPADGLVEVLPSPPGRVDVLAAFTGHTVIAADVDPEWVSRQLPSQDLSAPVHPYFVALLAQKMGGTPGILDAVWVGICGQGVGSDLELIERDADYPHHRVHRSVRFRTDLRVWTTADDAGLVVLGRGVAERWEIAVEVDPARRGEGLGRRMFTAAACLLDAGTPLFAQISPGNAASLRAAAASGLQPIGSEVILRRT